MFGQWGSRSYLAPQRSIIRPMPVEMSAGERSALCTTQPMLAACQKLPCPRGRSATPARQN
jgi:hypothetical protein